MRAEFRFAGADHGAGGPFRMLKIIPDIFAIFILLALLITLHPQKA